ncbi:fimbrial protein [Erwinia tasmaniensis]|uniref:Fimbrial protein subunit n=1 Tax=Erwinia tasmaniensis (strain DSM 17950 / CFBP 7177 / CIP 109463 / NCPPB 4357 / Et1/99) TaxID=465817 RepID=B2VH45_ERWT9|nr:fimbrial protein [Erwinia tasmaniensis]CAO95700.1 fimbrial protein subunit [Erwinia tasmaniensis Et1/99]
MRTFFLPLAVMLLASACAQAADTVNFRGDIVQTCTLSMNSTPLVVDLGKYPTSFFSKSGTESPHKPFGIHISGCPNSKIALKWSGNVVSSYESLLAVDGAKGVGIIILDINKNNIYSFTQPPGENMFTQTSSLGVLDFQLAAYYYSYENSVTAGPANASVTVEVIYG